MTISNTGLSQADIQAIQQVLSRFPTIEEAILYGSRAKGNYRPGSDTDLTPKGASLDHQTLLDIEWQLQELPLPYKLDPSLPSQLDNLALIDHITRRGKTLYLAKSPNNQ